MSRIAVSRSRMDSRLRRCRPRLERLEERWVPSAVRMFDFGPQGSPVRPGYTAVSENNAYGQGAGYGWLPNPQRLESRDRLVGDALTRDFVLTHDATFAVDLPNGLHAVTLTAGDAATLHNEFVFLEGQQVDAFTTHNNEFLTRTYLVNVTDGRLELRLKEQGLKLDDNAVINLLEIDTLADPVFDFSAPEGHAVDVTLHPHGEGLGLPLTYTLLSGPAGAAIDPQSGELNWSPALADGPGSYPFRVRVEDSADPTRSEVREFNVTLTDLPTQLVLTPETPAVAAAGTEWVLPGFVRYAVPSAVRGRVDFGDGTPVQDFTLNPDGSFELRHTYAQEASYKVTVTVDGQTGATTSVAVLPAGSVGKVFAAQRITVARGETGTADVAWPDGTGIHVEFTHLGGEPSAELFAATYTAAPLTTSRTGSFFDLQLKDAFEGDALNPADPIEVSITLPSGRFAPGWDFGFFMPGAATPQWVRLRDNEALAHIELVAGPTAGTMTMKVTFNRHGFTGDLLAGTVFTVSLPAQGDTTTGTVKPPTAQGDTGNSGSTSDAPSGQTRTLSFTSNAQLALALTASRDNQLASSSTARGSQAGDSNGGVASGARTSAALTATAGVGGEGRKPEEQPLKDDAGSFWRWLQSDEGMMNLWLNGIDPALLMQLGVGAEARGQEPESQPWLAAFEEPSTTAVPSTPEATEPQPWLAAFETPTEEWSAVARADAQDKMEEGDPADAPFISAVFLPVLFSGLASPRPRRRRAEG